MRWFRRWYGSSPLHLLVMLGCVLLNGYAAGRLLEVKPAAVLIWFAGAVVGHDLILLPLYVVADRSVMTVFRHRPPQLPTVPWINYLRVPAALSGMLLLIWFPLIFRIPSHFPRTTDLSLNPYLGHWLTVTGALFLLSAVLFAVRLRPGHRGRRTAGHARDTGGHRRDIIGEMPAQRPPVRGLRISRFLPPAAFSAVATASPMSPARYATPALRPARGAVAGILLAASRADDGLRQAWRRRMRKAVAMTLSLCLTRE